MWWWCMCSRQSSLDTHSQKLDSLLPLWSAGRSQSRRREFLSSCMKQHRQQETVPVDVVSNEPEVYWEVSYIRAAPSVPRSIRSTEVSLVATVSRAVRTASLLYGRVVAVKISIGARALDISSSTRRSTIRSWTTVCLRWLISCLASHKTKGVVQGHLPKLVWCWLCRRESRGSEGRHNSERVEEHLDYSGDLLAGQTSV
jgi:hypothetical protein